MKKIFLTLISSFLFIVGSKAALYSDAANPSGSFIVGTSYTFTYYYGSQSPFGNVAGNISSATATTTFFTGTAPIVSVAIQAPYTVKVTITPTHNGTQNVQLIVNGTIGGQPDVSSTDITLNGILPVELTNFSAKSVSASQINLNWLTASEKDNSMFKVEQSVNGSNFTTIGEVKGSGNSAIAHEYTYIDNNSYSAAVVYYRLKAVDFAGKESVSKVVSVITGNKGKLSLDVVKNDGRVIFVSPISENVTLSIYNLAGKEVSHVTLTAYEGANNTNVDLSNLNTGLYIARLSNSNDAANFKFVKN